MPLTLDTFMVTLSHSLSEPANPPTVSVILTPTEGRPSAVGLTLAETDKLIEQLNGLLEEK
jgi:hypothetical protein